MTRAASSRAPGRPRGGVTLVKPGVTEDPNAAPADESDDDTPATPAPVDSLSEMLSGLHGATSSRITIYRIIKNQPPSYVAECDPASFSLDNLRDQYRGGEFRLYIMKDGKLWKNMRVVVEPPPHTPEPAAAAGQLSDVLAVMRDGFQAQIAAVRELASARVAPPPSPLAGMDIPAVITAIAGAITALRPPAPPPAPMVQDTGSKAVEMFMQGLQMARELRDDSPAEGGIPGMLREVLRSPIVAHAVQAAAAPMLSHAKTGQPQLPPPQATAPAAPPAQSHPQPQPAATMQLTHYYAMLCQKAAEGSDPTLYADLILDSVDDETLNMLLTKQPTPLDALIAEYPPAAAHRDWFASLIDTLMTALSEAHAPEAPTPTPAAINGVHADAAVVHAPNGTGQPS